MKNAVILLLALSIFTSCGADADLRQNPADNATSTAPAAAPETAAEEMDVPDPDRAAKLAAISESISSDDRTFVPNLRFGRITSETTPDQLVEYYGAKNVKEDSIALGEGYFLAGYKLFPGTTSEASILYPGGKAKLRDMQITVDLTATDWEAEQTGIKIGTTLEELERLNGRPFTFFGFEWDYAGAVTDWQFGALMDYRIRVSHDFKNRGKVNLHPSLIGDKKTLSNNPALEGLKVDVIQMVVRLPEEG